MTLGNMTRERLANSDGEKKRKKNRHLGRREKRREKRKAVALRKMMTKRLANSDGEREKIIDNGKDVADEVRH